ncbi:uncharacterized protein LOC110397796 [Numida meleagris]|uniref:uncharacterized protein LOC110397796 n=1 Tax=Numida meleagris TaxID=8996 RepID=UPI000B3DA49B|nr:uncharacterized protein LOC110397796 [Numida meleagris]
MACPSSCRATFILAIPPSSAPRPARAGPPPPPQRRLPPPWPGTGTGNRTGSGSDTRLGWMEPPQREGAGVWVPAGRGSLAPGGGDGWDRCPPGVAGAGAPRASPPGPAAEVTARGRARRAHGRSRGTGTAPGAVTVTVMRTAGLARGTSPGTHTAAPLPCLTARPPTRCHARCHAQPQPPTAVVARQRRAGGVSGASRRCHPRVPAGGWRYRRAQCCTPAYVCVMRVRQRFHACHCSSGSDPPLGSQSPCPQVPKPPYPRHCRAPLPRVTALGAPPRGRCPLTPAHSQPTPSPQQRPSGAW